MNRYVITPTWAKHSDQITAAVVAKLPPGEGAIVTGPASNCFFGADEIYLIEATGWDNDADTRQALLMAEMIRTPVYMVSPFGAYRRVTN